MKQQHQSVVLAGLLAMALGLSGCSSMRGSSDTGTGSSSAKGSSSSGATSGSEAGGAIGRQ